MDIRVLKKDGKYYIELPEELGSQIELFKLKDGYYLLSKRLGETTKSEAKTEKPELTMEKQTEINNNEKEVIRGLLSVKFEDRTPPKIDKNLNQKEKRILEGLIEKKIVTVYKSKKYPNGVYNIAERAFTIVKKASPNEKSQKTNGFVDFEVQLKNNGYIVLTDNKQAYAFSQKMKDQKSNILAIKGFDQKFYAVTKSYYEKIGELMKKALKEEEMKGGAGITELSKKCGVETEAVSVVLRFLGEEGEVIERKKGIFSLA